jgi:hypothetical protein
MKRVIEVICMVLVAPVLLVLFLPVAFVWIVALLVSLLELIFHIGTDGFDEGLEWWKRECWEFLTLS